MNCRLRSFLLLNGVPGTARTLCYCHNCYCYCESCIDGWDADQNPKRATDEHQN